MVLAMRLVRVQSRLQLSWVFLLAVLGHFFLILLVVIKSERAGLLGVDAGIGLLDEFRIAFESLGHTFVCAGPLLVLILGDLAVAVVIHLLEGFFGARTVALSLLLFVLSHAGGHEHQGQQC